MRDVPLTSTGWRDGVIRGRKAIPTFPQKMLGGSRDPDRSVGAGSLRKDSQLPNQMRWYTNNALMIFYGNLS